MPRRLIIEIGSAIWLSDGFLRPLELQLRFDIVAESATEVGNLQRPKEILRTQSSKTFNFCFWQFRAALSEPSYLRRMLLKARLRSSHLQMIYVTFGKEEEEE